MFHAAIQKIKVALLYGPECKYRVRRKVIPKVVCHFLVIRLEFKRKILRIYRVVQLK